MTAAATLTPSASQSIPTNSMVVNSPLPRKNPIAPNTARLLARAMQNPDEWVVRIRYQGKDGVTTERIISPIKMVSSTALLALCLCREEPRRFELERCSHIELVNSNDVLMPIAIRVIALDANSATTTP